MICLPCQMAGDLKARGLTANAVEFHTKCEYPKSCTCLHRVDGIWHE